MTFKKLFPINLQKLHITLFSNHFTTEIFSKIVQGLLKTGRLTLKNTQIFANESRHISAHANVKRHVIGIGSNKRLLKSTSIQSSFTVSILLKMTLTDTAWKEQHFYFRLMTLHHPISFGAHEQYQRSVMSVASTIVTTLTKSILGVFFISMPLIPLKCHFT